MLLVYKSYRDVPAADWKWKNFTPQELACRGTGELKISTELMDKLQKLRTRLAAPLIINSAYRSPAYNAKVGGAKNSYHMQGVATDISMANHDPTEFEAAARAVGFTGFGFYPKQNFIHIDIGPKREWGKRWKAARFEPEPKDKTPKKMAGTLGFTAAAAGVTEAVKPDNLRELQGVVAPMLAYAPQLQVVCVAAGFGIVGWFIWAKFMKKAP